MMLFQKNSQLSGEKMSVKNPVKQAVNVVVMKKLEKGAWYIS
jgi:hypothetical protein